MIVLANNYTRINKTVFPSNVNWITVEKGVEWTGWTWTYKKLMELIKYISSSLTKNISYNKYKYKCR